MKWIQSLLIKAKIRIFEKFRPAADNFSFYLYRSLLGRQITNVWKKSLIKTSLNP